ncbi:hypothetical protein CleRT_01470 [Candidatus Coxiella mudrowiae]|uniref:Uncharacterized protein n=1 Tax=Candidatus Coxiella mudrowiae TaxID=2054173 RepID=A0ABM5UTE6_9COXI|nr:hypothetical protein CleRT_01470 [Candidatus Coxiella mudrowiae]
MEFNLKSTTVVELNRVIGGSAVPEQGSPYTYSLKSDERNKRISDVLTFNSGKIRGVYNKANNILTLGDNTPDPGAYSSAHCPPTLS